MKTPQPVPAGYVKLEFGKGEVLRAGDKVVWEREGDITTLHEGHSYTGRCIDELGMKPESHQLFYYVRPVAQQGWISVGDRQPTEEDYQGELGILAIDEDGEANVFEMDEDGAEFRPSHRVTHWQRITPPPAPPVIKVEEHKVDFRKDGSIKVGCTEVSSELFEKIAARRKEEMA